MTRVCMRIDLMILSLVGMGACAGDQGPGAPQGEATTTDADPGVDPSPTTPSPPPTGGPEATSTGGSTSMATTGVEEGATTALASTGPSGPVCGDGVIDPGEACDDGDGANTLAGACLPDCSRAACGDGHVQAGKEECDLGPGNSNAYGGCTPGTCLWGPRCGDGVLSPGHEQCDPGAPVEPGDGVAPCTPTCRFAGRVVFLSSEAYTGDLGGVSGADLKCQALAKAFDPQRAHTYRAWLSDGVNEPVQTFAHGEMFAATPYVLRNGVKIAGSFEDLVQHGPIVGITVTDTLEVVVGKNVWTHTTHEGKAVPDADHCGQWTTDSFKAQATVGVNALPEGSPEQAAWAAERWWTRWVKLGCNISQQRLYCFEN